MAVMVGAAACAAVAEPAETKANQPVANPDEVLRAALPENALPNLKVILGAAMANAPRVIDSGLNVEQSDAGVQLARAPMLPRVAVSANPAIIREKYQYEDSEPVSRVTTSLFYNAGISQPIFHWGALYKGLQSAKLQKAISERNLAEVRRLLAADVRKTYLTLINASNARTVDQQGLKKLETDQEYHKVLAADGFEIKAIADGYITQISDYKLLLRRAETGYQSQWRAFRLLTGLDTLQSSSPLPREIPAVDAKVGEVLAALSDSLGDYTPAELANANDRVKTEQLNYDITKTRLRPQLDLSLSASQQNQTANNDQSKPPVLTQNFGAYLSVNWTLFDGFSTQALKRSSAIRLRQLRTARDQSERDLRENLRTQVETLRVNWESLQRTEELFRGARDSVETFKKDYEAGIVPKQVWDAAVTAADNALYAANSARADFYLQIVNYLSLRGKDPAVNYRPDKQISDASKN